MLNFIRLTIITFIFSVGNLTLGQILLPSNEDLTFAQSENSFLNPNNLTMNQSVSFMTSTGKGFTSSVGMYSNYINYQINPKLNISTGIHFIQPSNTGMFDNPNSLSLNYDFHLNYQISENFRFEMNVSNIGIQNYNYRNYFFNQ
ncbi:MAG: hypothetical protein ISR90_02200 [Candidatus Marinimicrobia bacterium]|nr:hypothetical protein [Candidatus Neomarinimicrobiota bacterium]MBL7022854.1 hypothetical protein [Candidatus Neomarinimicrobiota bacterium]MBL7110046.1 hypothetical protein [Candidatus Neomarinimicrobiota bacterium]